MNINPLSPGLGALHGVQDAQRGTVEQERAARQAAQQPQPAQPAQPVRSPLGVTPAQASLPAEPPAGTDPELWSVLSSEERVFFARAGAMGPLTYGRMTTEMRAETNIPRGGRLDVKA